MGKGFLQVQLYVGDFTLHGQQMAVQIMKDGEMVHIAETDEGGATELIELEAPDLTVETPVGAQTFETYDVIVPEANGFKKVSVYGVQIFDGITSVLDVHLEPLSEIGPQEINIYVPRERGASNGEAGNNEETVPTWTETPQPPYNMDASIHNLQMPGTTGTAITIDDMASDVFRKFMARPLPDNFDMTTFLLALILLKS